MAKITDKKLAVKAIEKLNEITQAVIYEALVFAFMSTDQTVIRTANVFERLTGYPIVSKAEFITLDKWMSSPIARASIVVQLHGQIRNFAGRQAGLLQSLSQTMLNLPSAEVK
jgi:hypothetical protein